MDDPAVSSPAPAASPGDLSPAAPPPWDAVAVILPARNEARHLERLLPRVLAQGVGQVIVADNGSRDATARVARELGATVVSEPRPGYGAACWAGMGALRPEARVVVFLDADGSDDPARLPELAAPILAGRADFVLGTRVEALREPGSMTPAQLFGNALATRLIRLGWGWPYRDLGPFRAIRREALERIGMRDRRFGWTVEMQVRAVEEGLRILEIPVPYRRSGRSQISGTLRGVVLAGYWILRTLAVLWWQRRRPASAPAPARAPRGGPLS